MTRAPERTALVTGAGSPTGIGFAAAEALGRAGYRVALTSTTGRIHDRVRALLEADGHFELGPTIKDLARLPRVVQAKKTGKG